MLEKIGYEGRIIDKPPKNKDYNEDLAQYNGAEIIGKRKENEMNVISLSPLFSLDGVFANWKNTLWDNIYSALTNLIIPILILISVVFLVIGIGGLVADRRSGAGSNQKHIVQIVISLAAILLLGSFYVWGPMVLAA